MANLLVVASLSVSLLRLEGKNIGYLVCITAMGGPKRTHYKEIC